MKDIAISGMCYFSDLSIFDKFKHDLRSAFKNSDLNDVTVDRVFDDVIVVFEWAKNNSDLEVSHAITESVVKNFGGEYKHGED